MDVRSWMGDPRITIVDPPDGQLKLDDKTWGFGFTLGALYEFTPATRIGLTYNSPVQLNFSAPLEFTGLSQGLNALLASRGSLNASLDVGITVPQQVMASVFHQINQHWALLGSAGWQQWSQFGQVQIGVDSSNPTSTTTSLDFKDTWHLALGAQYRLSDAWLLNGGVAYDSGFQSSSKSLARWDDGTGVRAEEILGEARGAHTRPEINLTLYLCDVVKPQVSPRDVRATRSAPSALGARRGRACSPKARDRSAIDRGAALLGGARRGEHRQPGLGVDGLQGGGNAARGCRPRPRRDPP